MKTKMTQIENYINLLKKTYTGSIYSRNETPNPLKMFSWFTFKKNDDIIYSGKHCHVHKSLCCVSERRNFHFKNRTYGEQIFSEKIMDNSEEEYNF